MRHFGCDSRGLLGHYLEPAVVTARFLSYFRRICWFGEVLRDCPESNRIVERVWMFDIQAGKKMAKFRAGGKFYGTFDSPKFLH